MSKPREGAWFAKPRPVRFTARPTREGVILVAFGGLFAGLFVKGFVPYLGEIICLALGTTVVLWHLMERWALRTLRSDREFSERTPGLVEYAMEILIVNDGKEIGMDRGFMWIEKGLLHFNGAATSFTLAAVDILPRRKIECKDPYHGLPGDCIRLWLPGRPVFVRLMPLGGSHHRNLGLAIGRFLATATSAEARQWPPLEPFVVPVVDEIASRYASVGEATDLASSWRPAQSDVNHLSEG